VLKKDKIENTKFMSYHSESDNMMSESVEQFKELARQIEGEEHGRGDEREPDSEREYRRSNFERERKLDSTHSSRYQPYSTSRPDRESRSSKKEHRVYVYNLPFSLKWQDLKDHMKKGMFSDAFKNETKVNTCKIFSSILMLILNGDFLHLFCFRN
jgi:hypothetical protein